MEEEVPLASSSSSSRMVTLVTGLVVLPAPLSKGRRLIKLHRAARNLKSYNRFGEKASRKNNFLNQEQVGGKIEEGQHKVIPDYIVLKQETQTKL